MYLSISSSVLTLVDSVDLKFTTHRILGLHSHFINEESKDRGS